MGSRLHRCARGLFVLLAAALSACGGDGAAPEATAMPAAATAPPFTASAQADAVVADLRKRILAPLTRPFTQHGWYWTPSQGGTGFMIEAQGDVGFVTFFMYEDGTGKPIWYYGSGIFVDDRNSADGQVFFGELAVTRGGQPVHSPTVTGPVSTPIGAVLINFAASGAARVVLPGGRTINAERFDFNGLAGTLRPHQPETGWYWNPAEGGRGYAIEVQNDQVFMAMFHYNADGSPTWNVVQGDISTGVLSAPFESYEGGQSLTSAFRPARRQTLGPYTLSFRNPCAGQVQRAGVAAVSIRRFTLSGSGLAPGAECRGLATLVDLPGTNQISPRPRLDAGELAGVPGLPLLQPGDAIFGKLDVGGDADLVAVALTAGVSYRFRALGNGPSQSGTLVTPALGLYDPAGSLVGGSFVEDAGIEYTPVSTGLYVLKLFSVVGSTGTFLLTAERGVAAGLDASPIRPQAAFAGSTRGELHGRDTGSFNLTIGTDGRIAGTASLTSAPAATLPVDGVVRPGGAFVLSASSALTASGYIGPQGDLSGSWSTGAADGRAGGLMIGERSGAHVLTNQAPQAIAGNVAFSVGTPVTLTSTSTDPDGDPLTHRWYLLSSPTGSTVNIANATSPSATLTTDRPGAYVIVLVVNDGRTDAVTRVRALAR